MTTDAIHTCDVCGQAVDTKSGDYYLWNYSLAGWSGGAHGPVPEPMYRHPACERRVRVVGRDAVSACGWVSANGENG